MLLEFSGYSKKKYTFNLFPIGTSFKSLSGVYIFLKANTDNNFSIIYIGEAGDFEERLNVNIKSHQQYECIKRNNATHIALLAINGIRQNRLDVETDLRHQYSKSACNDQ